MSRQRTLALRAMCGTSPGVRQASIDRINEAALAAGAGPETLRRLRAAVELLMSAGPGARPAGPCQVEVWHGRRLEIHFLWPETPLEPDDSLSFLDAKPRLADEITVASQAAIRVVLVYHL